MKVNFPFVSHLKYRLYVYLLVLLCIPVATCLLINLKAKPKAHEKFSLFIGAEITQKETIQTDLESLLSEDLVVKVDGVAETNSLFSTKLQTSAMTSDIVILSKTKVELEENDKYALINEGNPYYNVTNYIDKYDHHLGILATPTQDSYLSKVATLKDEPYYVCINKKSVHGEGFMESYSTNQIQRVLNLLLGENL